MYIDIDKSLSEASTTHTHAIIKINLEHYLPTYLFQKVSLST